MTQVQTQHTGVFWDKVNTDDDCWIWTGAKNDGGYGHFHHLGKTIYAHRFAYEQVIGPIPPGMMICHTCDNRACVRPAHLFLGSAKDNTGDMVQKGRHTHGHAHYLARLSDEDVLEIRRLYDSRLATNGELARRFGVHPSTIWQVTSHKCWKHL